MRPSLKEWCSEAVKMSSPEVERTGMLRFSVLPEVLQLLTADRENAVCWIDGEILPECAILARLTEHSIKGVRKS